MGKQYQVSNLAQLSQTTLDNKVWENYESKKTLISEASQHHSTIFSAFLNSNVLTWFPHLCCVMLLCGIFAYSTSGCKGCCAIVWYFHNITCGCNSLQAPLWLGVWLTCCFAFINKKTSSCKNWFALVTQSCLLLTITSSLIIYFKECFMLVIKSITILFVSAKT